MHATAPILRPLPDPSRELERLFREHHDQVFRAAYRVTGSLADAEDVLQTVFLRLAKREAAPDLSPSPAAYLHRAAVNGALDLVRSRLRSKSVPIEEVETGALESDSPSPEAEHADRELRRLVRRAIAGMSERSAEICALRYFEGYGNREIAEMLGTSQMVVSVVLHRARVRLRKEIGPIVERTK